jgi:lipopolysaccharide cholinephosphotransferase
MCPKSRRPLSDWKDLMYVEFEFLTIPIPKNYDPILRQQYGDYMKIPQNIGENMHGELIISTSCPYSEYQF